MITRFFTMEQYHNKRNIGSTRLRVHNLLKHWPEAAIYKYGENNDVMIYQKVYTTQDYKFQKYFPGIQILDICDPDWLDGALIGETLSYMDGATCPTEELAQFMRQLTDKPIKVIPDRHDLENVKPLKVHSGEAKSVVWYGYKQNAELLTGAIPTIERLGLKLTIISNSDPVLWKWADDREAFQEKYTFKKYQEETILDELAKHDVCVLPIGMRPHDRFKSNNRTTRVWLAGVPIATDGDQLRALLDPDERNKQAKANYELAKSEYNVVKSVEEMKEFIEELQHERETI